MNSNPLLGNLWTKPKNLSSKQTHYQLLDKQMSASRRIVSQPHPSSDQHHFQFEQWPLTTFTRHHYHDIELLHGKTRYPRAHAEQKAKV
jgi:hypothetical protein